MLKFDKFIKEGNLFDKRPERIKESDEIVEKIFNRLKDTDINKVEIYDDGFSFVSNMKKLTCDGYVFQYKERSDWEYAILKYQGKELDFSISLFNKIWKHFYPKKEAVESVKRREEAERKRKKEEIERLESELQKEKQRKKDLDFFKNN